MALDKTPRVCWSAGHGIGSRVVGKMDSGAVSKYGVEATKNLGMAKRLHADCQALFYRRKGCATFLRDQGYYYLADDYAADNACDHFHEIHFDSGGEDRVTVLYKDSKDKLYAERIADEIGKAMGVTKAYAVYRPDLAVLKEHAGMKQVLIEIAVLSDASNMAKYEANVDIVEVAIINSLLRDIGWKYVKTPPRTWSWTQKVTYRPY